MGRKQSALRNGRTSMIRNCTATPTLARRSRTRNVERQLTASALLLASAWLVASGPAQAQQRGPLVLAKSSYFFVGGKIDPEVPGSAMVGQMYVEYMIPQRQTHRIPIVMVHGGSQTGTNF